MNAGIFQKSMPQLSQLRPISYTDLPGFAGSGTPLFRMSSAGGSGISGQLKDAAAPDAGASGDGAPGNLQKAIPSIGIVVVIFLALILLH